MRCVNGSRVDVHNASHLKRSARRGWGSLAAALFALLLLNYATVQSVVMQAAGMPAETTHTLSNDTDTAAMTMPGMGMRMAGVSAPGEKHSLKGASQHTACSYCAAAANLPVIAGSTPLRVPTAFVFTGFPSVAIHGPRGPPERDPRARGPPSTLTSA